MTSFIPEPLRRQASRGFTIVELLVVSAISILLMTISAFVYSNCLKIYQEGLGAQSVFETSKLINGDMRAYLGNVVAIPGAYISPKTILFPGVPNATNTTIGDYYIGGLHNTSMTNTFNYAHDKYFSGAQTVHRGDDTVTSTLARLGWTRTSSSWSSDDNPGLAATATVAGAYQSAWWMPAFFGKRDGTNVNNLKYYDMRVGSWGWPRPDYRMDADALELGKLLHGGGGPASGTVLSCWFYAEEKNFDSVHTKALDNANIVLVSIKFSMDLVNNKEETQLSFLKHHVCGFDGNGHKWMRSDQSYANMLRAIKIEPLYLDAGNNFTVMDNAALGCDLAGTPSADPLQGREIPRAFDVRFTLSNPANQRQYRFSLRIFNQNNN